MRRELRDIQRRIRSSKTYNNWKLRNKGIACLRCDSEDDLELHHIVSLSTIVKSMDKFYDGDLSIIYEDILALHDNDSLPCATICKKCHESNERQGTFPSSPKKSYTPDNWCVLPRNLGIPFCHKKSAKGLNFIPFQILMVLGWYVMNGYMKSRIMRVNITQIARLMNKRQPSCWKKPIMNALKQLRQVGAITNYIVIGKQVEIHMSPTYLENILDTSWFFPLNEVDSPNMLVLTLKWFLSTVRNTAYHQKKKRYSIAVQKLMDHLGTKDTPSRFAKRVVKACEEIKWAKATKDKNLLRFYLRSRPVPIHALWRVIDEDVKEES
jgi:hypothetical protein